MTSNNNLEAPRQIGVGRIVSSRVVSTKGGNYPTTSRRSQSVRPQPTRTASSYSQQPPIRRTGSAVPNIITTHRPSEGAQNQSKGFGVAVHGLNDSSTQGHTTTQTTAVKEQSKTKRTYIAGGGCVGPINGRRLVSVMEAELANVLEEELAAAAGKTMGMNFSQLGGEEHVDNSRPLTRESSVSMNTAQPNHVESSSSSSRVVSHTSSFSGPSQRLSDMTMSPSISICAPDSNNAGTYTGTAPSNYETRNNFTQQSTQRDSRPSNTYVGSTTQHHTTTTTHINQAYIPQTPQKISMSRPEGIQQQIDRMRNNTVPVDRRHVAAEQTVDRNIVRVALPDHLRQAQQSQSRQTMSVQQTNTTNHTSYTPTESYSPYVLPRPLTQSPNMQQQQYTPVVSSAARVASSVPQLHVGGGENNRQQLFQVLSGAKASASTPPIDMAQATELAKASASAQNTNSSSNAPPSYTPSNHTFNISPLAGGRGNFAEAGEPSQPNGHRLGCRCCKCRGDCRSWVLQ